MAKLELNTNMSQAIILISEGNPGAASALIEIIKDHESVDPDAAFGKFSALFSLDTYEIYGPGVWELYNNQCKHNSRDVIMLLRACQLGFLSHRILQNICGGDPKMLIDDESMAELDKKVIEALPKFKKRS